MRLHEILDRDPRTARLANNGQARIISEKNELIAELKDFVSDGQFGRAIERIVERFLGNIDGARQESVWISGFYGSGKSHLLKMLTHLWVNTTFEDGSTARGLVRGGLPDNLTAQLRELDIQAKRTGKRAIAAEGTMLGGNDRVRETILSIILTAVDQPAQYPQARFCFWLREQGYLEKVQTAVEEAGREWLQELNNLYVSPHIAQALIKADSSLASNVPEARQLLINQFPVLSSDISTAEFIEAVRKAISPDDNLPLTLIVLDEVQQYINEATDRSAIITEVSEALQTQFDSRVMLVGAGQSALSAGTPALMWLRDRFPISFELEDSDVEVVTRKVLLQKKTSANPDVESMYETFSGETSRHLQETKIGVKPEDVRTRVMDYPLLPTRRRFWDACFQAADRAGSHSQLRSQLRILNDSLKSLGEKELGAVIPASDLFHSLSAAMVNTGVLLNELNARIQNLDDGTDEGSLKRDLCGLVFLIGKLPRETGVDLGIRSSPSILADLLIPNISLDSGPFRNQVAETLESLEGEGTLMKVEDEYRLQTSVGAEWERVFREKQTALRQNEVQIAAQRDQLFTTQVQKIIGQIKLNHGSSKIPRKLALHLGAESPNPVMDNVVVWLRDGWSFAQKDVTDEARRMGQDDPVIHVFLPMKHADDLKARIINANAAQQVLDHYGAPTTPEGHEARESMNSRLSSAELSLEEIVLDLIRTAKVFQGGGGEVYAEGLSEKIISGANDSLARLYPRFGEADHNAWHVALKRAREGSDQPLKVVDWENPTEEHPVAKGVLNEVGSGARGNEVQKKLKGKIFGWPQDAIDAVLIALHRSGHLRATRNGNPVTPGQLDQASVKVAEFRPEQVRLTTTQRISLRGLFEKVEVKIKSGEEEMGAEPFLEQMNQLARESGGEPPLPQTPNTTLIEELSQLAGSEQLSAIHEHKETLESRIEEWSKLRKRKQNRESRWLLLQSLAKHAEGLDVMKEVQPEMDAILAQCILLESTDPLPNLLGKLSPVLRESLNNSVQKLSEAVEQALIKLSADATWQKLDPDDQSDISKITGLTAPETCSVSDDQKLKDALDNTSLESWQQKILLVPSLVKQALDEAARRLEKQKQIKTTKVSVRLGTLNDINEVQEWISEHEQKLKEAISKGAVIVN